MWLTVALFRELQCHLLQFTLDIINDYWPKIFQWKYNMELIYGVVKNKRKDGVLTRKRS